MDRTIDCTIITPERSLYNGKAEFVVLQAHDGQIGFMMNHAPIISELGIGEVRLMTGDKSEYLYIEGGVVELMDNKLIVLAEQARLKEELDKNELQKKLDELNATPFDGTAEGGFKVLFEKERVSAQLKVATR